jgi:hypothetical protein
MRPRGQVALETIMIIGLWIVLVFFFLNIMFLLSSAILTQTGVNRLAVQVGSLGCQPGAGGGDIDNYAEKEIGGLGVQVTGVDIVTWRAEDSLVFQTEDETDSDLGRFDPETGRPVAGLDGAEKLAFCGVSLGGQESRLGDFIYVGVSYKQSVALPSLFGLGPGGTIEVYRSATTTSSRIEGGALGSRLEGGAGG